MIFRVSRQAFIVFSLNILIWLWGSFSGGMMKYKDFLENKKKIKKDSGFEIDIKDIHNKLFDFQKDIVKWAILKGRAAVFLDTGLGKTFIQLEWCRLLGGKSLIVAPLSVSRQTIREAKKIDIEVKYIRESEINDTDIYITNYEMINNIDFELFNNIVLDESSILKSITGKIRKKVIKKGGNINYRLACTATPAPNDNIEIGSHAEFLGICTRAEMLGMFFINANKEHTLLDGNGNMYIKKGSNKGGTEWRLKHHAEEDFYRWMASWSITMIKPEDLGYEKNYELPELNIKKHIIETEYRRPGELFFTGLKGISDRAKIRKDTAIIKLSKLDDILEDSNEQWIIWCGLSNESTLIKKNVKHSIEVKGSDSSEYKIKSFEDFIDSKFNILITKSKIGGYGMNFQNAHNMVFYGLNDSWEAYYQCIRRQYRYGQKHPVNVHIIITNLEIEIYNNIMRKELMAQRLRMGLIKHIKKYEIEELGYMETKSTEYKKRTEHGDRYTVYLGDSCTELKNIKSDSIDLSVYSPPFADLYTYTDSIRDLGNSKDSNEFFKHYAFIIRELLRITKQGRLSCVHTSDIAAMAQKDGYIGIKDFPGDVIRAHIKNGWIFHGRAFVQKNPQAQAIRIHSKALLFAQLRKDSSDSRPALVDQILIFKKEGEAETPVTPVENGEMDNETWIEWANGIWIGIHETDTLRYHGARALKDEKHICPLQLGTIERCIKLYSNKNETILTPFMGIGSEIYQALLLGRKGIGIELKESYFNVAVSNLKHAEMQYKSCDLFAEEGVI